MTTPCLLGAWSATEAELRGYLRHRMGHQEDVEDLLQEVFIKALRQDGRFCQIENPRAWLFQVARNALADRLRVAREHIALPDDLASQSPELPPLVDDLTQCLPRVLSELSDEDRLAITLCDIEGGSQQELADRLDVSRQTVISLEQGRYNPSLLLAFRIARVFGLKIEEIFLIEYENKY